MNIYLTENGLLYLITEYHQNTNEVKPKLTPHSSFKDDIINILTKIFLHNKDFFIKNILLQDNKSKDKAKAINTNQITLDELINLFDFKLIDYFTCFDNYDVYHIQINQQNYHIIISTTIEYDSYIKSNYKTYEAKLINQTLYKKLFEINEELTNLFLL